MPTTQRSVTTSRATPAPAPGAGYVQRGHTVKTVRESETVMKNGKPVKKKTRIVYYVDDKPVKLNWFDRLRIRFMSTYEKQAFLAGKLLKQEKRERARAGR